MDNETKRKKFLGCIIGAAIGDTIGAPFELWTREQVMQHPQGTEWIDDMLPFVGAKPAPRRVWCKDPPMGTGTDDTRLNQVFVEGVIKYGTIISSKLLAAEYIDRYVNAARNHPQYAELAAKQFEPDYMHACGLLGMDCPIFPGTPPYALLSGAQRRGGFPSHIALMALPSAGLLHPGDPETAYRHAFELAYMAIGYGQDAAALLAAMVAAGFDESLSPRQAIRKGLAVDPFRLDRWRASDISASPGMVNWYRTIVEHINHLLDLADQAQTDQDLVFMVSREVQPLRTVDARDIMGLAVAACYRSDGDPKRTILMAVNERDFDENGGLKRYRDIDCTGAVAGALVGALAPAGLDAFPSHWIEPTISANREIHGFDITDCAERMYEVIARPRGVVAEARLP